MSNTTPLWTWLLREEGDGESNATDMMVSALLEGAQRLGMPATGTTGKDSVLFQAQSFTLYASESGQNNCINALGNGAGEVRWSLGHRPFLLMYYASLKVNQHFQANQFGEPKLMIADESVRLVPEMSVWSEYETYLKPFVENGLGLKQTKEDLIALGLVQAALVMSFGEDDDDDGFYPLIA